MAKCYNLEMNCKRYATGAGLHVPKNNETILLHFHLNETLARERIEILRIL